VHHPAPHLSFRHDSDIRFRLAPHHAARVPTFFLVSLLLLGSASAQPDPALPVDRFSKPIIVPTSTDNYPNSFLGPSGHCEGFAVDLLDAVARVMDFRLERIERKTGEDRAALINGTIDILQSYSYSLERESYAAFSASYLDLKGGLFINKSRQREFPRVDRLDGQEILIVGPQSIGERFVHDRLPKSKIAYERSGEAALRTIQENKYAALFLTRLTALSAIEHYNLHDVVPLGGPLESYDVRLCFAVRKGDAPLLARLNEGLAILHRTGEFDRIYRKWFGTLEVERFSRDEVAGAVTAALALGLVVTLWAFFRQHELRRRVSQQAQEIAESRAILAEAQRLAHVGHSQRTLGARETITWSDEIYRIFERDPKLGPPLFDELMSYAVEDDRVRWSEVLRDASLEGKSYEMEVRIAPRPGMLKIIHVRGRPMRDASGAVTGLFGTAQDVTEWRRAQDALRQSEQLLRALYNTLPHALGVVEHIDRTWRLVSFNPGAVRLLGLPDSPAAGTAISELGLGAAREAYWTGLFDRSARENSPLFVEHTDQERKRDYAITLLPLGDSSQRPRCCFFIEDITERRLKDSEISRGRRLRAIGELVGGIAHEFNNLLTPILLKSDQLQHDPAHPPALRAELKVITDAARRSADLTRRLLAFGRTNERAAEEIDFQAILKSNVELVRQTIDRRIFISDELPPELPLLHLNSGDLHQIFLNLLLNARDTLAEKLVRSSTADWSANIEVTATVLSATTITPLQITSEPPPEKWLRVTVRDNGMGMPPTVIERIFEPFYTTKQVGSGTGLGLATVWHLVSDLGGRIDVESTVGQGSAFHVCLPVRPLPAKAIAPAKPGVFTVSSGPTISRHLLVVEDEDLISRLVLAFLRRAGHTVEHAANGHAGWELLSANPAKFDAVLMDLNMPGFSGLELARRARALPYSRPLFVMSGRVTDEERAELKRLKISAVIQKPFTNDELLSAFSAAGITSAPPVAKS
jgi:two-component system, cell cycle sensor histidine kinase and response regulator CckA